MSAWKTVGARQLHKEWGGTSPVKRVFECHVQHQSPQNGDRQVQGCTPPSNPKKHHDGKENRDRQTIPTYERDGNHRLGKTRRRVLMDLGAYVKIEIHSAVVRNAFRNPREQ